MWRRQFGLSASLYPPNNISETLTAWNHVVELCSTLYTTYIQSTGHKYRRMNVDNAVSFSGRLKSGFGGWEDYVSRTQSYTTAAPRSTKCLKLPAQNILSAWLHSGLFIKYTSYEPNTIAATKGTVHGIEGLAKKWKRNLRYYVHAASTMCCNAVSLWAMNNTQALLICYRYCKILSKGVLTLKLLASIEWRWKSCVDISSKSFIQPQWCTYPETNRPRYSRSLTVWRLRDQRSLAIIVSNEDGTCWGDEGNTMPKRVTSPPFTNKLRHMKTAETIVVTALLELQIMLM